jgi:tryptophanyl-tRNA synthetase
LHSEPPNPPPPHPPPHTHTHTHTLHHNKQLTDDEKFLWRGLSVEEARRLARENARDIIACGFDVSKTYIFADFDAVGGAFYRNVARVQRCVTMNQVRGVGRGWVGWGGGG